MAWGRCQAARRRWATEAGTRITSEVGQRIAEHNPHIYQRDVENIVNASLDEISDAMTRGDRVELRGFGAFSRQSRPPRVGPPPPTGAPPATPCKTLMPYRPAGSSWQLTVLDS